MTIAPRPTTTGTIDGAPNSQTPSRAEHGPGRRFNFFEAYVRCRSAKLSVLLVGLLFAGCATATKSFYAKKNVRPHEGLVSVALMPPDVELYELTAGGMQEPKANWTETARLYVTAALEKALATKDVRLVLYDSPTGMDAKSYGHTQIMKLHEAVGTAILKHKYFPRFELPTKEGQFDWSLGREVSLLGEESDAQYGLFIHLRDSYASTGRVIVIIGAALLGYNVSGGTQLGFASLVDLQSGDIVWFNRLARGTGDLRTPEAAREAVEELLTDLPL